MMLQELGDEGIEARMQDALATPSSPGYRLCRMMQEASQRGRCLLVLELCRPSPASTQDELAKLARNYVAAGADALVVRTDAEDTPAGLKDLFTVVQAVKVPVLRRDWVIHPLQVVEAKEAGAAGVLGVICQVNGKATPVLSSFAAAIGLDAPVEVVNNAEVEFLSSAGVVFYAINVAVGLSVSMPGVSADIAHGILGKLPFGAVSLVGIRSLEQGRQARQSGADALLVKQELLDALPGGRGGPTVAPFMDQLMYAVSGDD